MAFKTKEKCSKVKNKFNTYYHFSLVQFDSEKGLRNLTFSTLGELPTYLRYSRIHIVELCLPLT